MTDGFGVLMQAGRIMASALESYVESIVNVITNDGRSIVVSGGSTPLDQSILHLPRSDRAVSVGCITRVRPSR